MPLNITSIETIVSSKTHHPLQSHRHKKNHLRRQIPTSLVTSEPYFNTCAANTLSSRGKIDRCIISHAHNATRVHFHVFFSTMCMCEVRFVDGWRRTGRNTLKRRMHKNPLEKQFLRIITDDFTN